MPSILAYNVKKKKKTEQEGASKLLTGSVCRRGLTATPKGFVFFYFYYFIETACKLAFTVW